jgi:hypothetical protein
VLACMGEAVLAGRVVGITLDGVVGWVCVIFMGLVACCCAGRFGRSDPWATAASSSFAVVSVGILAAGCSVWLSVLLELEDSVVVPGSSSICLIV